MGDATIVSLYPADFLEQRATLVPNEYFIPASDGITPQVLHLSGSFYMYKIDDLRGQLRIDTPGEKMAESLINDFMNSMLYVSDDAKPAIFWVPGKLTSDEVLKKHPDQVKEALAKQRNWFVILVRVADDEWAASNHKHRAITDLQRAAARNLRMERDWLILPQDQAWITCPACGTEVTNKVAVCPSCRCIINEAAYSKLKFAGVS